MSFLLSLSRSLSFLIFLVRFADGKPGETEADPEETISEERHLLLVVLAGAEASERAIFFNVRDFFLGSCPVLGVAAALGLGTGASGGRAAGGVSSKDG